MKNKISLYQINQEQAEIISEIEEMEGEITPEVMERLAINKNQLTSKSIAYVEFIGSKKSFNSLVDDEIKRLKGLKSKNEKIVAKLEQSLLNAVTLHGEYKVGTLTFSTRKSSTLEVTDLDLIPKKYIIEKTSSQPDKMALKTAIKNGEIIEGAEIKDNFNLSIK